jgi:hypothetical protein
MTTTALRTLLIGTLLVGILAGCQRTRRTVIEEEVGGIGTAWTAGDTKAGLWQDQAALTSALEAALWKVSEEPAAFCRNKRTAVEVVVFPSSTSFSPKGTSAEGSKAEAERIQSFVQSTAERRIATLGCATANVGEGAPDALARVTVAAWGWDVEAVASVTTTIRSRGREIAGSYNDEEGIARIRARATVHIDIYDGRKMASASADGSSKWRVLTGRDARTWPLDQLPLIYEPPSRLFEDSYEEGEGEGR